jgi:hypothetical protein
MERAGKESGAQSAESPVTALPAAATQPGSLAWASAVGNRAVQRYARQIARLTPDEILGQYQVDDDTTEEWTPKVAGAIPIPFAESRVLTSTEGRLLDSLSYSRGLVGLSEFRSIAQAASAEAIAQFPNPGTIPSYVPTDRISEWKNNDGHRDAFRHCYWNAWLAGEFGQEWTEQFTTAHEALPGNTAAREAMDLYNNSVGRSIMRNNPGADAEELAALVRDAVDEGRLIVVNRSGNLAWSNTVAVWDHGLAPDATREGRLAVPAGDASAE